MKIGVRLGLAFVYFVLAIGNCRRSEGDRINETLNPVLSTLFNRRMLLLLKGTYSSDSPLEWNETNGGTGALFRDKEGAGLDPIFSTIDLPMARNLPIFLDFGEVRISSKYTQGFNNLSSIRDPAQSNRFWDFIGNERQVMCTVPYTLESDTCQETNGQQKASDFFNGVGAQYPSNDPSSETVSCSDPDNFAQCAARGIGLGSSFGRQYYYTGVYFRALVTGYAVDAGIPITNTRFDNRRVFGLNIVPRNNYNPGTTQAEKQTVIPKLFPLLYTQLPTQSDMEIRSGFDPYILEIRMNIKENLMVHSFNSVRNTTITFVGISDWSVDHKGESDVGGNLQTRARVIYPETASSLNITGGQGNLNYHFGVFRRDETEFIGQLPLAATPARSNARIRYLNPGNYQLVCLGDVEPRDGHPEVVTKKTEFQIPDFPFRQNIQVDLSCP